MRKVSKNAGIIVVEIIASVVGGLIARAVYDEFKRRKYCTSKGYNNFEDDNNDGFLDEGDADFDAYDIDLDPDNLFLDEGEDETSEKGISDDFFDDDDDSDGVDSDDTDLNNFLYYDGFKPVAKDE